ncbi:hypothetical protein [Burkholderia sp. IMCC1007]|uniref:hypothetical protein n=1 Tax=Burkholderia sp. IMCC1007 TaxID=3004104 RepID=UPI0022B56FE3|nr:hypothetical protein [Burkholderia sp. IMCC1007]
MDEPSAMFNGRKTILLLCAVSIAAAMAPTTSLATCALPGCHGQPRSSGAAAQANVIYGDPVGNTLKGNSGTYRQSVSDASELRTFATAAAVATNPYADDVERMGYARGSMYSGTGAGSVSSLRSARRAGMGKSVAGMLPGVQGLSVGIPGAASRLSR